MDNNNIIVCYTGGTCGDLITAMIDHRDATFNSTSVVHNEPRRQLKKPMSFANDETKDIYLQQILKQYNSIPSHDLDYHVKRKHQFISITVEDPTVALWAATRFKLLHRPHVWNDMQRACGASTIEDYAQILIHYSNMVKMYTDQIITLESIRHGTAILELEKLMHSKISTGGKNFYQTWLRLQINL